MSFDEEGFLEWLETEVDGYYVKDWRVAEEWPEFFEQYSLIGVTGKMDDDGDRVTPVRDYKQAVTIGQPLD